MPLQIIRQDITKMKVDAIVNTTNEEMVGYSGVDLAVHTIAGPELDAECATLPPLGLGKAQITETTIFLKLTRLCLNSTRHCSAVCKVPREATFS